MLAQLGSVTFELWPLNTHENTHGTATDFAAKPVLGRRPLHEYVGEGEETWRVSGRLFPDRLGGLEQLAQLHRQRLAGVSVPFLRGDGTPLGWVLIEKVTEKSSYLDARGVGQLIEFDVELKRDDPPAANLVYSVIAGLLG